jgi:cytoskeletal protein CcmA (bactofilin family)
MAQTAQISGKVTGDVFVLGSQIDVTGKIERSFRAAAGNVILDGEVDGNVLVSGGSFTMGSKAHVKGNLSVYTGQFVNHGTVDGSMEFAGGTVAFGGKVGDDATITADAIAVESGARIDGDVTYSTRKPMDDELKAITGGSVTYDEHAVQEKKTRARREAKVVPSTFQIGKWIAFFVASFLFGCALLAVFGAHEPTVSQAIATDALRCTGIGFVTILVSFAVCLSAILIITIPFIAIYVIAYIIACYLAKIPVAVWVGRRILDRPDRKGSAYRALLLGLLVLYVVFMIPVLGVLAQLLACLLGLGAMTKVYLDHRAAKKVAAAGQAAVSA